jgi:SnoaL-like domain
MAIPLVHGQTPSDSVISVQQMADRQAIQDLINAYSRDADRRRPQEQADLFTDNAIIEIYHAEPGKNKPDTVLRGRKELLAGFLTLKKYEVTMHFNGQNTIRITGDSASGEVYCLAHHLWVENGKRMLMVMGIRYYDKYVRRNGQWLFAERKLIFDWVDKRPSSP